ncbi:hypothetical protein R6Q59_015615 [Mikania micrantha]
MKGWSSTSGSSTATISIADRLQPPSPLSTATIVYSHLLDRESTASSNHRKLLLHRRSWLPNATPTTSVTTAARGSTADGLRSSLRSSLLGSSNHQRNFLLGFRTDGDDDRAMGTVVVRVGEEIVKRLKM